LPSRYQRTRLQRYVTALESKEPLPLRTRIGGLKYGRIGVYLPFTATVCGGEA